MRPLNDCLVLEDLKKIVNEAYPNDYRNISNSEEIIKDLFGDTITKEMAENLLY